MDFNIKWWIIFWLISPLCTLHAQSTQRVILLADQLADQGQPHAAIEFYRRAYFFGNQSEKYYSALRIAQNEMRVGHLEAAVSYYDLAALNAHHDSLQREVQLEKTALLLIAQNPKEAYIELLSIKDAPADSLWQRRLSYYFGAVLIALEQWQEAEEYFGRLMPDSTSASRLHQLFRRHKHKKTHTAKRLSYLLPGAGYAYVGDWETAFNSLLLTGGIATVGITTGLDYGWGSSIWTVNWFTRYYRGGAINAAKAAHRVNNKRDQQLLEQINQLIFRDK